MCVIVDANVAQQIFGESPSEDFVPVREWIEGGSGCLSYGGKLAEELFHCRKTQQYLLELDRSGKANRYSDAEIVEEVNNLVGVRSNDSHVIGLARISGSRVLCTEDQTLIEDFTNRYVVNNPRGKIYKRPEHSHLLRDCPPCEAKR